MSKTMTKYQLDHFRDKVKRQFNPMIEEQELLVKQYKTEATDKAVDKLSKKIGADKIINKFRQAEKKHVRPLHIKNENLRKEIAVLEEKSKIPLLRQQLLTATTQFQ